MALNFQFAIYNEILVEFSLYVVSRTVFYFIKNCDQSAESFKWQAYTIALWVASAKSPPFKSA